MDIVKELTSKGFKQIDCIEINLENRESEIDLDRTSTIELLEILGINEQTASLVEEDQNLFIVGENLPIAQEIQQDGEYVDIKDLIVEKKFKVLESL